MLLVLALVLVLLLLLLLLLVLVLLLVLLLLLRLLRVLKYSDVKVFDEREMIAEISPSPLAQQLLREVYSDIIVQVSNSSRSPWQSNITIAKPLIPAVLLWPQ
jgi:hypothetical protein